MKMEKIAEYLPGLSWVSGVIGAVGGGIAWLLGGWDMSIAALMGARGIDFLTGFKGLCRKGMTLLVVLIAASLDRLLGASFIRDAVIVAYLVNELISIAENAALMGVPFPAALQKAIDILKKKSDEDGGDNDADT